MKKILKWNMKIKNIVNNINLDFFFRSVDLDG